MSKRRAAGEGTIYQRSRDGRWCAELDINGQRRTITSKSQKDLLGRRAKLLKDHALGLVNKLQPLTVGEYLEQWLEHSVRPHRRAGTYESYCQVVRLYIAPYIGERRLDKLTPQHVQMMLNALLARGLSSQTVRNAQARLGKALDQAQRWGHISRNVARLVDMPQVQKAKIKPLTTEQAQALLNAAQGQRLEALYRVALGLGLRKGEVLGLHWVDVDFAARTLRVSCAVQSRRRAGAGQPRTVLVAPKNESSIRTLPLPDVLAAVLRAHSARQELEREYLDGWQESGLVFPSERGTPMSPRNLIRSFKSLLRKAGLPASIRFHDLRHSCATFLIAQNVHIKVVSEILGHSSIKITGDIYGHVMEDPLREAADGLDKLFTQNDLTIELPERAKIRRRECQ